MQSYVGRHRAEDCFSASYDQARNRFRESAASVGASLLHYPIGQSKDLTVDVAILPDSGPMSSPMSSAENMLVISSGVHGVEGPFGSAVQLAWLDRVGESGLPDGVGVVLIHAVNPYGFAHYRRWNEAGVDLNRNFLASIDDYVGAPPGYIKLDPLLNPRSAPSRWEPFRVKAAWNLLRFGIPAIKEAVASGQYEYGHGLFFGGKEPSASTRIFAKHYASWSGEANRIVHLDFHTGLGRFGEYRVLIENPPDSEQTEWFTRVLGNEVVEPVSEKGTAYQARGTLGSWTAGRMAARDFRFATIDFGTYGLVRVLAALRAENRVHHYARNPAQYEWAKRELRECFCPASARWRRKVVSSSQQLIANTINGMRM